MKREKPREQHACIDNIATCVGLNHRGFLAINFLFNSRIRAVGISVLTYLERINIKDSGKGAWSMMQTNKRPFLPSWRSSISHRNLWLWCTPYAILIANVSHWDCKHFQGNLKFFSNLCWIDMLMWWLRYLSWTWKTWLHFGNREHKSCFGLRVSCSRTANRQDSRF